MFLMDLHLFGVGLTFSGWVKEGIACPMPVYGTMRYYHIVLSIKEEGRLGIFNRRPRHLKQTRGPSMAFTIEDDE